MGGVFFTEDGDGKTIIRQSIRANKSQCSKQPLFDKKALVFDLVESTVTLVANKPVHSISNLWRTKNNEPPSLHGVPVLRNEIS